jgi:hypothetical protein
MLNRKLVRFSLVTIIRVTVLLYSAKSAICQSDRSVLAHQYVAKGSDIETLDGHVERSNLKFLKAIVTRRGVMSIFIQAGRY